ncbi:MAG: glycosyl hydrolase repeat-containing glycosyl hydrolase [Hyphomicrobiales bacterium]|nr:glycosyl hydrolase repeat-containing glycosyl hydrolase [Hyphomicrobiales bacterium]
MAKTVLVLLGTKKGVFILESDESRRSWALSGPFCETWPIQHAIGDPATGAIYAGGGSEWFGPAVWKSLDRGRTWTHSRAGLTYESGVAPIKTVWSLALHDRSLYVGVEPAGLFRSEDAGATFEHLDGLQKNPTRPEWSPGGAGLILHSIVVDRADARQIWVGISAAGVFHSADGGASWEPRNSGTRCDFLPEDQRYPVFGQCVHSLVQAPGSPRLYQQNHCGMYRSDDGGRVWESIEAGLPSSFGFPAATHPRDPDMLYLVPLNGDSKGRYMPDAQTAVWRTRSGGESWQAMREGLPQDGAFFGVLRQALATDSLDKAGVYFGTSSGSVFASRDEGETWSCIAQHLPVISSVETLVLDEATGAS